MKNKIPQFLVENKNIGLIALVVGMILLIPLAAMQFTDEVAWSLFDFATAGVLLFGTGLAFELTTRKAQSLVQRAALGGAIGTTLLLVWANLAVGIIGSEDNPLNMLYLGVLAVVVLGSLWVRLQPRGMQRVLAATAAAQAVVMVVGLVVEKNFNPFENIGPNIFFIILWLASALLFRWAGEK